jgi:hypothetical protein
MTSRLETRLHVLRTVIRLTWTECSLFLVDVLVLRSFAKNDDCMTYDKKAQIIISKWAIATQVISVFGDFGHARRGL